MCPFEPGQSDEAAAEENLQPGNPVPGEVFTENYNPYEYTMTDGPDGLPIESTPPWQSQDTAPIPMTPETLACLRQAKDAFNKWELPQCEFYKRQRVHNPTAPDRPFIQRFCTNPSLRGINGAALSLDDAGIFDCEFRHPENARATPTLDAIDARKIDLGRKRLIGEAKTGKVVGYRMFRTPEDVAAGRTMLEEDDSTEAQLNRAPVAVPDPFEPDDVITSAPEPSEGEQTK